jgi:hypothetical protein
MRVKDEVGNFRKMQHKVPILNYIPKFERIEFSSDEMQVIEKQKWYSKIVWASFGINASELGYTEDGQGVSNQIVQSKVFRKKAINPALRLIEKSINRQIIPEFEYTIQIPIGKGKKIDTQKYVFKFKTFDIDEERNKAELYKLWLDSGMRTINELRLQEGLSVLDWGDNAPMGMQMQEQSFAGDLPDEEQDLDFDFEMPDVANSEENLDRNESRVNNKSLDLKHKYRSRKRVGDKWVYDYGDEGKPNLLKQESAEDVTKVLESEDYKSCFVDVIAKMRDLFKGAFNIGSGQVNGFLKDFIMLKHKSKNKGSESGKGAGKDKGTKKPKGDKKKSKLQLLLEKWGLDKLPLEQQKALIGQANETYEVLFNSVGETPEIPKKQGMAGQVEEMFKNTSFDDVIKDYRAKKRDIAFSDRFEFTKEVIKKYENEFIKAVKGMETILTRETPREVIEHSNKISDFLFMTGGAVMRGQQEKDMALFMFNIFNKDVAQTNKVLKYMSSKERVTKKGLRELSTNRTAEEIMKDSKPFTYKDVYYNIGKTYFKNQKMFKTEEEMQKNIHKAIDFLPNDVKKYLKNGDTKVNFVTRDEAKTLAGTRSRHESSVLGFYISSTKDVYIYPPREEHIWKFKLGQRDSYLSDEEIAENLRKEGYDPNMFTIHNEEVFQHTIVHELGHAIALNPDETGKHERTIWGDKIGKLQKDYEAVIREREFEVNKDNYISHYASTNANEDFA